MVCHKWLWAEMRKCLSTHLGSSFAFRETLVSSDCRSNLSAMLKCSGLLDAANIIQRCKKKRGDHTKPICHKVACHHCILPMHVYVLSLSNSRARTSSAYFTSCHLSYAGLVRISDTLLSLWGSFRNLNGPLYCTQYLDYRWVHVLMGS